MSRMPSNRRSQSFVEFSLIIILLSIVLLSILLILGDSIRTVLNDILGSWFPTKVKAVVCPRFILHPSSRQSIG